MLLVLTKLLELHRCSEVLFPRTCLVCHSYSSQILCHRCQLPEVINQGEENRCLTCYEKINFSNICPICKFNPPLFQRARYLWEYSNNARDFCVTLKYKPSLKLIEHAAQTLAEQLAHLFDETDWNYIIPIPASNSGLAKRGFNHMEVLARNFIRQTNLQAKIQDKVLIQSRKRKPQASMSNRKRLSGIRLRYKIGEKIKPSLKGKKLLLLDDVTTTGATLNAALFALKDCEAKSVDILTLCRSPTWYRHRIRPNHL